MLFNSKYQDDLNHIFKTGLSIDQLKGNTIMVTGGTGLIGSYLIDLLMNATSQVDLHVIAVCRNLQKAKIRFKNFLFNPHFSILCADVTKPLHYNGSIDYVFHTASNANPVLYATEPINTILTTVEGTNNILSFSVEHHVKKVVYLSSIEVYGENRGDVERFDENYCGYINCNLTRSGYPESKRVAESLCQSYISQYKLDVVIARLGRTYGPTFTDADSRVIPQFIRNVLSGQDIIMKSNGLSQQSSVYVFDAIYALLVMLFFGANGEVYNICDNSKDVKVKTIAEIIALYCNKKVCFQLPDNTESKGFSVAKNTLMDSKKLQLIGWHPYFDIESGLRRTLEILMN